MNPTRPDGIIAGEQRDRGDSEREKRDYKLAAPLSAVRLDAVRDGRGEQRRVQQA
jgi:hypothetical protein